MLTSNLIEPDKRHVYKDIESHKDIRNFIQMVSYNFSISLYINKNIDYNIIFFDLVYKMFLVCPYNTDEINKFDLQNLVELNIQLECIYNIILIITSKS